MKTVCVTGATAGIGLATTGRFIAGGWQVIAAGRRADRLEELAAAHPGKVLPLPLDVRDKDAVFAAFSSLPAAFAEIEVLVNNAGLSRGLAPAHECPLDDWERMVDTNIKGLMYCSRAVLPGMVERGRGHVVNIGSIAGSYAYPGGNVYCSTKAFVEQFSRSLRCDLHGTNVHVTNIEPGLLESEFSLVRFDGDAAAAAGVYRGTEPLLPDDIADAIWWACSRPARVNINRIEVMPVVQSNSALRVWRKDG
jgi:NADP-dependent 3-hydroxy acid dehydrogenase YdfG